MAACRFCGNTNPADLVVDQTIGQPPLVNCLAFCMALPAVPTEEPTP